MPYHSINSSLWDKVYITCIQKKYSSSPLEILNTEYRQTSNISQTTSQNLNVYHVVLQLSLCNILKPGVKLRMKM